jgi:DNA polymerase-3 subunit delta
LRAFPRLARNDLVRGGSHPFREIPVTSTTDKLLKALDAGTGPRCVLLVGDDLRIREAATTVINSLIPAEQQAFNLERLDGHATPWEHVRLSLLTPPFLPGTKVVWLEDAPYFISGDQRGVLGTNIMELWDEGKEHDAGKRLMDLLALEGWTQARWETLADSDYAEIARLLNSEDAVAKLVTFCKRQGMDLSRRRNANSNGLDDLLTEGMPPWAFLLMTATQADRRMRIYKRLEQLRAVLSLGLERERFGRVNRQQLHEFVIERLRSAAKTADAQAQESILRRSSSDLRNLSQELEKLCLYAVDRPRLRTQDVETILTDYGEGGIFDLTRAIGDRDSCVALANLNRLVEFGQHPLQILGALANDARRLITARKLLDGELRAYWRGTVSYQQFQQLLQRGKLSDAIRGSYGDYMCLKRAEGFSMRDLRRYISAIHDADGQLKSTGNDGRLVLERLILSMCLGEGQRDQR